MATFYLLNCSTTPTSANRTSTWHQRRDMLAKEMRELRLELCNNRSTAQQPLLRTLQNMHNY